MTLAAETLAKERRRFPRSSVMLPALLDQFPVTVTDVSLGGIGAGQMEMMIDGELGPERGQRASLRFLDHEGFAEESIEVEIVRVSTRRGSLGVRYLGLTAEQDRFLKSLLAKNGQA
jgi:hypothetical protein